MLRYKKRKISAAVLICSMISAALLMGGCGEARGVAVDGEYISFLQQNPVTVQTVEMENFSENAPDSYLYTKIEVSGMEDGEAQKKINAAITEEYEAILNGTPGYRGFTSRIDASQKKESEIISMNVTGNFNGILSVLINKTVRQSGVFYTDYQTMNFDVNTGEEIRIRDLFTEEGLDSLNTLIGSRLDAAAVQYHGGSPYDAAQDFQMLSMFKGVTEDQKFYLDENKIHVVLDYTNPEFYQPHFTPYEIDVGFDRLYEGLLLNRYAGSETDPKYLLVYGNGETRDVSSDVPEGSANLHYGLNCTYPEDMPESGKEKSAELAVFDAAFAEQLKSEAASNPGFQYGYTNTVRGNRIGNYYNLIHSVSYYKANYWGETVTGIVYDMDGNIVALKDLFQSGVDYEAIIKDSIAEQLSYDFPDGNYGGKTIDDIYGEISFTLDSYGLQIKTQPIPFKMELGETDYESSVSVFIPYEEFGCDQMTIFN